MKWKKIGKIFDPTAHNIFNDTFEFAQSPQTIIYKDFVRIYFSTRKRDNLGKYLSLVAFVDINLENNSILKVSSDPVIDLGSLGSFDEHGIFPFSPFQDDDKLLAYTCGWSRRVSVSVDG